MISYPKELDGRRAQQSGDLRKNFREVLKEVLYSFKRPALIKTISNISLFSGYYRAVKDYIQPVLQTVAAGLAFHFGIQGEKATAILVGMIYFFIYLLSAYASRISGQIAKRFHNLNRPLNLSLLVGLILGLISGLFFIGETSLLVGLGILIFIGIYLVENLRKPIGIAYVTEILDKDILATALSTESQVKSIFSAIMAPVIGFFADLYGIGIALLIISALVLAILPFVWARKRLCLNN